MIIEHLQKKEELFHWWRKSIKEIIVLERQMRTEKAVLGI